MMLVCYFAKLNIKRKGQFTVYSTLILMAANMINGLERDIIKSPNVLIFPRFTIGVVLANEGLCVIGMTPRLHKNIWNTVLWCYFLLRLYFQYGLVDRDLLIAIVEHLICSDYITKTILLYFDLIIK